MFQKINSDYFSNQPQPAGTCNADILYFVWGSGWILKILDNFRLKEFKVDLFHVETQSFQANLITHM
jgi:hypothetical protein